MTQDNNLKQEFKNVKEEHQQDMYVLVTKFSVVDECIKVKGAGGCHCLDRNRHGKNSRQKTVRGGRNPNPRHSKRHLVTV